MSAIVFAGPSLPELPEVESRIDLRPPASAGDIFRAVRSGAELVGLVDVRFEDGQTVRHDEILFALSEGVHVWGAASMGALRAVECAPFGMRGFGRIFDMYCNGMIDGDHEVALLYGPEELGFPPLTVPLVNVRASLERATGQGILDPREAETVLGVARSLHYKKMTWTSLLERLVCPAIASRLQDWLPEGSVDLKNQDALILIDEIESFLKCPVVPFKAEFEFQRTVFWRDFVVAQANDKGTLSQEDADVMDELRLDPLRYSEAVQRAFARHMAETHYSESLDGGVLTADEIRSDFGLMTASAFQEWLIGNRTNETSMVQFLEKDSHLENILEEFAASLTPSILDELRAENEFSRLDRRATDKRARLEGRNLSKVPSAYAEFDLRDLLEWFCSTRGVKGTYADPDEAARSLGLPDRDALHLLLRREFEYSREVERCGNNDQI